MNSVKIANIKFIDAPIECYYPAFRKDKTLCYEYYSTFLLNDELYSTDDFAVVKGAEDIEVIKFICIFATRERKVEAVVRKYLFARNLKDKLIKEGCIEFDADNEVVEDFRKDYIIKAEQIIRKCTLVFAQQDESACIIKEYKLDPLLYFSCRYTLKSDGLFPIFSTPQTILSEHNFKSPSTKLGSAKKQKRKFGSENVPLTHLEDFDDCSTKHFQDKMRSPKNPHKNMKISECSININSPIQRNLVKRNLNKSFGNSPNEKDNSILNYSIVSDEDIDNPFVLKLRISENNKTPIVVLKKYDDDSYEVWRLKQKKSQEKVKHSPVRKSTRAKERKSYADYISPIKNTPIKRRTVQKVNEHEEMVCPKNSSSKKTSSRKGHIKKADDLSTPTKSKSENTNMPIRTPKRYQDERESPYEKKLNLGGSVRRSLRLTQTEEHREVKEITTSPRNNRKNKRQMSISSDREDIKIINETPEKKINLDESMRRSILRVRLNTDELKDGKALVASGSTPKIKNRRITNNFYFESSSEDEENTTCKSRTIDRVKLDESINSVLSVSLNRDELEDGKASIIESGSTSKSKNRGRNTKDFYSESSEDEEHATCKSKTMDRVNLAESIRKSLLRVNLNRDEFNDGKASVISGSTPKRKNRGTTKNLYFDSSSEDGEHATCKSKTIDSSTLVIPKTPTTRTKSRTSTVDISQSKYGSTIVPKTPKTRKNIVTPKNTIKQTPKSTVQTPKTPRNRAKLIRDGLITPSMQSRSKAVVGDSTPLMKARSQLHVSYVPTALPCREKEYCDIFNFLEGKLLDGCGGCMYISGVPGTGKTATVTSVINNLLENDDVPKFSYANINGMRLTEPRQSYVEILKQLTGKMVPWEQAHSMLEERFTKSKKFAPVIMLIDELDILCTKRQDVVYNLLDWPTKAKNQLIVVTIANTMDLPERLLMNRVTSRLGLTRLTFQAYTHKQLQEIVTKRLSGTNSFNPDAIQFVARKVASVSGDARRALDICRRAAEIAETEGKNQLVNMSHVNEALNAMITQPKVRAIKHCSRLEQLLLQSIVAEVERTGVEETTFADVFKMLVSCTAIDGFRMVSSTVALSAVSRLSACRLILTDQKCSDINQRVILNVSVDDVYYALKRD